jgi:hypothetical protein
MTSLWRKNDSTLSNLADTSAANWDVAFGFVLRVLWRCSFSAFSPPSL